MVINNWLRTSIEEAYIFQRKTFINIRIVHGRLCLAGTNFTQL